MDRKEKRQNKKTVPTDESYDFYDDFKLADNNTDETINNNNGNVNNSVDNNVGNINNNMNNNVVDDQNKTAGAYQYQEKQYKTNTLEEHTVVSNASKVSRLFLYGFYLIFIVIGVMVFFLLRADRYEFYLKHEEVNIGVGSSYQVELIPKNIRYFDYLNYNYKIGDESIATVDEFGTVSAISSGTTTLKISLSPGFTSKTMKINTESLNVETVTLMADTDGKYENKSLINMNLNETITLKPVINNREDINTTVKYSSSNPEVASIDELGYITSKKEGTTVITGEKNGVTGSVVINVKKETTPSTPVDQQPKEIQSVSFTSTNITLKKGNELQLSPVVMPKELANSTMTYSSSDSSVVTVDNKGNVKAIKEGTAIITVTTSNGKTATCNITVSNDTVNISSIKLNSSTGQIVVGSVLQLTATISPANATVRSLTWTSSNTSVATVNNGLVMGVSAGTATITVKSSDEKVSATCIVTVENKPVVTSTPTPKATPSNQIKVTGLEISPGEPIQKTVGESIYLNLKITPANATTKTASWKSNDPSVADIKNVNGSIILLAYKKGTAVITAEVDGVTTTRTVIVKDQVKPVVPTAAPTTVPTQAPVVTPTPGASAPTGKQVAANEVTLSKTSLTVSKGSTQTFDIKVSNAAGTIIVSSSNTSVATVSSSSGDCNKTKCFFDNNSITFTVTGVSNGTANINVNIDDLVTYEEKTVTGTGSVGVLVQ